MQKESATNTFNKGLVMDFNPIVLPQNTLCNALNATIITMNGNENVLLNDMGNGRVETAYLPEGYIPLGSAELGGIIYIVSYNPLINKCLIGSFPSPERNITSNELTGNAENIINEHYYSNNLVTIGDTIYYIISSPHLRILIYNEILNPGDKYLLSCSNLLNAADENNCSYISAFGQLYNFKSLLFPRYLKFAPISIALNGAYTDMSDTCVWQPIDKGELDLKNNGYYLFYTKSPTSPESTDLDDYRDLVSSQYNVFSSRFSGQLGVLASLECIDSFEVAWDAYKIDEKWNFYFFLNWTYNNTLSSDKINLYGIYIDTQTVDSVIVNSGKLFPIIIENYPHYRIGDTKIICGNTDIMNYQESINNEDDYTVVFCTPKYIDSLYSIIENKEVIVDYSDNEAKPRLNNGSDNLFLLNTPYSTSVTTGILEFDLYPMMPFGILSWFKQHFKIDLDKLGSGEIDLFLYRYYVDNNTITLLWGLDAYPERNKKINSVAFTYYPIEGEVYEWLKSNAEYIDSYKGMDRYKNNTNVWVGETNVFENYQSLNEYLQKQGDTTEYYSYTDSGKTTYSGNFSDILTFDNIVKYTTYLVQIKVDYDGDSIDFYRIMYTEPIFNSVFYQYEDFANIILKEIIDTQLKATNIIESGVLSENKSDTISSFKYELLTEPVDYIITNIYDVSNFSANIEGEVKYKFNKNYIVSNTFNVEVNISKQDVQVEEVITYETPLSEPYSNSGISSYTEYIDPVYYELTNSEKVDKEYATFTIENNKITGNYRINTCCPTRIYYNKFTSITILYLFTELVITPCFIMGTGRKKSGQVEFSYYFSSNNDIIGYKVEDNKTNRISYSDLSNVKNSIDTILVDSDIACIGAMEYSNSSWLPGETLQMSMYWGYGDIRSDSRASLLKNYWGWNSDYLGKYDHLKEEFPKGSFVLFYAIKTLNNNTILFTYQVNPSWSYSTLGQSGTSWADITMSLASYYTSTNNLKVGPAFAYESTISEYDGAVQDGTIIKDVVYRPFLDLYKLVDYGGSKEVWEWSIIFYYPRFTLTYEIDIPIKVKEEESIISLQINGNINISELQGYIKNFEYSDIKECNIIYLNTRVINIIDKINEIVSGSDLVLTGYKDDEGNILVLNSLYNQSYIYKKENLEFTQVDRLSSVVDNGKSSDNYPQIKCKNGFTYIIDSDVKSLDTISVLWLYDEQGIVLDNIYLIPK